MNVLAAPSPGSIYIPELLYAQFQSQFAAVAVGILLGAVAERARIFPTIVFTFVWTTLVYCPMVQSYHHNKLIPGMLDLESNRMGL
jgi:ammonium transporter, Amt family